MRAGGEASSQPGPYPAAPGPEPGPPDVVTVGGALADEVVGFVQGLLPEVAGAVGIFGDHQHILLEHQGLVTFPRAQRRVQVGGGCRSPPAGADARASLPQARVWPGS